LCGLDALELAEELTLTSNSGIIVVVVRRIKA
jgi:hypothetical protein